MKLRVSCETWRRFAFGVMVGAFAVFLIGVAGVVESDFLGTTKIADFLGAEDIRETAMAYLDVALLGVVSFLCADHYLVLRKVQEIVNRQNTRLDNYARFVADMTGLMEREFRELHRKVDSRAADEKQEA